MRITFTLNGEKRTASASPVKSLLDLLTQELNLPAARARCRRGECGACLVLLDSELVNACLVPVFRIQNRRVTTVEGLLKDRFFQEMKKSLNAAGLLQGGFCESGVLMAIGYLLTRRAIPTEMEIREALSGTVCHAAGYNSLVETVMRIASARRSRA